MARLLCTIKKVEIVYILCDATTLSFKLKTSQKSLILQRSSNICPLICQHVTQATFSFSFSPPYSSFSCLSEQFRKHQGSKSLGQTKSFQDIRQRHRQCRNSVIIVKLSDAFRQLLCANTTEYVHEM